MRFEISRTSGAHPDEGLDLIEETVEDGLKVWTIEIDSLHDLVAFARLHGSLIVGGGFHVAGHYPTIEIYDDYGE